MPSLVAICLRRFILISAVLCVPVLTLSAAAIPNLVGQWDWNEAAVTFENVLDPSDTPHFQVTSGTLVITAQNGRLFAGYGVQDGDDGGAAKITGVVLEDQTVQMLMSDKQGTYSTISGKVSRNVQIKGTSRCTENVLLADEPQIASGYFEARKR